MAETAIRKRLGREEASGGFIQLEGQAALQIPAGKVPLRYGQSDLEAQVVDHPCLCKGDERPHTHRRVMVPGPGRVGLRAGRTATLTAQGDAWLLAFR